MLCSDPEKLKMLDEKGLTQDMFKYFYDVWPVSNGAIVVETEERKAGAYSHEAGRKDNCVDYFIKEGMSYYVFT